MPHVFTLEGLTPQQLAGAMNTAGGVQAALSPPLPTVHFPTNGTPLAPAGAPIGPARPLTPVFGPGGTPLPYRAQYPARGPVCDYCVPDDTAALNGAMFGDAVETLRGLNPLVAGILVLGGSMLTGAAFGGLAVWTFRKLGYRTPA